MGNVFSPNTKQAEAVRIDAITHIWVEDCIDSVFKIIYNTQAGTQSVLRYDSQSKRDEDFNSIKLLMGAGPRAPEVTKVPVALSGAPIHGLPSGSIYMGFPNNYYDTNDSDRKYNPVHTSKKEADMTQTQGSGVQNVFNEIFADAKQFVKDNKNILYTVVLVFLVDHFVFDGAFRERIKTLFQSFIDKTEAKLKGARK